MGQCLSESVPLVGEGPACNRLARDLGCEAERVGESPEGAVPVCNPFGPACNRLARAQRNESGVVSAACDAGACSRRTHAGVACWITPLASASVRVAGWCA
jgi:hypothetical protein